MPYILQEDRRKFVDISYVKPMTAGELNYCITMLCHQYLAATSENGDKYSARYQKHNDVIGALEGAKLEFYRRMTGPYEDVVIEKNGDL
jgi:hypothetical protein